MIRITQHDPERSSIAKVISLGECHLVVGLTTLIRTAAYLAEILLETLVVGWPWILTCVLLAPVLAAWWTAWRHLSSEIPAAVPLCLFHLGNLGEFG